jgi:hypothetical protein
MPHHMCPAHSDGGCIVRERGVGTNGLLGERFANGNVYLCVYPTAPPPSSTCCSADSGAASSRRGAGSRAGEQ